MLVRSYILALQKPVARLLRHLACMSTWPWPLAWYLVCVGTWPWHLSHFRVFADIVFVAVSPLGLSVWMCHLDSCLVNLYKVQDSCFHTGCSRASYDYY